MEMTKTRRRDMKDTQTLLLALVDTSRPLGDIVTGCMRLALLVIMMRKPLMDVRCRCTLDTVSRLWTTVSGSDTVASSTANTGSSLTSFRHCDIAVRDTS
ncbi:hypothetical protein LSAT2_013693 [Lamellibrachia satsuma]|nr:hypothetical protein LSAT2_013693 [Lamellibrachia satsuma]